jgi:hypothetical protein
VVAWRVEVQDQQSAPAVVTGTHTVSGDLTPPGAPTNLSASAPNGGGQGNVYATAPSDLDTVALRFTPGGTLSANPGQRRMANFNIYPDTTVTITVVAIDAAGNVGPARVVSATATDGGQ